MLLSLCLGGLSIGLTIFCLGVLLALKRAAVLRFEKILMNF